MFSQSLRKHFKDFGSGFTDLHAKLNADAVLDFAIHHRENKTQSQKSTFCKNNVCSQHSVT
jgi:hypothetical protein